MFLSTSSIYTQLPRQVHGQGRDQDYLCPQRRSGQRCSGVALQLIYPQPTVIKEADGIWVLGGYSITNVVVIETEEGLIIIDSGDSEEEGNKLKEAIRKNISQKPIIAAIYTHSHYCMGTGESWTTK